MSRRCCISAATAAAPAPTRPCCCQEHLPETVRVGRSSTRPMLHRTRLRLHVLLHWDTCMLLMSRLEVLEQSGLQECCPTAGQKQAQMCQAVFAGVRLCTWNKRPAGLLPHCRRHRDANWRHIICRNSRAGLQAYGMPKRPAGVLPHCRRHRDASASCSVCRNSRAGVMLQADGMPNLESACRGVLRCQHLSSLPHHREI
jgi:hypothetical protein